jgi:hypothetical protein
LDTAAAAFPEKKTDREKQKERDFQKEKKTMLLFFVSLGTSSSVILSSGRDLNFSTNCAANACPSITWRLTTVTKEVRIRKRRKKRKGKQQQKKKRKRKRGKRFPPLSFISFSYHQTLPVPSLFPWPCRQQL